MRKNTVSVGSRKSEGQRSVFTISEVASHLGISARQVESLLRTGALQRHSVNSSGEYCIHQCSLNAYISNKSNRAAHIFKELRAVLSSKSFQRKRAVAAAAQLGELALPYPLPINGPDFGLIGRAALLDSILNGTTNTPHGNKLVRRAIASIVGA